MPACGGHLRNRAVDISSKGKGVAMKALVTSLIALLVMSFVFVSCAQESGKQMPSSTSAIEKSNSMKTPEEKGNFLVQQAQRFLDSKQYEDAQTTAQHVITNFQAQAAEAKKILKEAAQKLIAQAGKATEKARKNAAKAQKDATKAINEAIGNLGK